MGPTTINLHAIQDGLEGNWWHYIRGSSDFAFLSSIPDQTHCQVDDGDILIHKQILAGDSFPTKRYHVIVDGEPLELEGTVVRETMADKAIETLNRTQILPYGIKFDKVQANGKVAVFHYNPNDFDNFQLKIDISRLSQAPQDSKEALLDYCNQLPATPINPLQATDDPTFTIEPLANCLPVEQAAKENGSGTVFISNAIIDAIDLRKSVYQGSETIYYLLRLSDGIVASSDKKGVTTRTFDHLNIKCSDTAFEKYELKPGDRISFNGKEKNDKKLKYLIQNIRKFTKS